MCYYYIITVYSTEFHYFQTSSGIEAYLVITNLQNVDGEVDNKDQSDLCQAHLKNLVDKHFN